MIDPPGEIVYEIVEWLAAPFVLVRSGLAVRVKLAGLVALAAVLD